jgi:hypothetical protein
MTSCGDAEAATPRAFPAPGSQVPGAPPPLKRALTPADGVAVEPRPLAESADGDALAQAPHPGVPAAPGSHLFAAAAMAGMALGLEVSRLLAAKSRSRRRHGNAR